MDSNDQGDWAPARRKTVYTKIKLKAEHYHERVPFFRKLPGSAIAIILLLVTVNILVWVACGVVLAFHRGLVTTAVLSYTLGLRHALDADHITAIDLMTRRLVASGRRPVTVGTFFSLGHSTVVIVTSIVVAASSAAISNQAMAYLASGFSSKACQLLQQQFQARLVLVAQASFNHQHQVSCTSASS